MGQGKVPKLLFWETIPLRFDELRSFCPTETRSWRSRFARRWPRCTTMSHSSRHPRHTCTSSRRRGRRTRTSPSFSCRDDTPDRHRTWRAERPLRWAANGALHWIPDSQWRIADGRCAADTGQRTRKDTGQYNEHRTVRFAAPCKTETQMPVYIYTHTHIYIYIYILNVVQMSIGQMNCEDCGLCKLVPGWVCYL